MSRQELNGQSSGSKASWTGGEGLVSREGRWEGANTTGFSEVRAESAGYVKGARYLGKISLFALLLSIIWVYEPFYSVSIYPALASP